MMKDSKLSRKARSFCYSRLFPVLLLWGCCLISCKGLVGIMNLLVEGEPPHLKIIDFSTLGDVKPLVLMVISVLMVMGIMYGLKSNFNPSTIDQANMESMIDQLWDEVSSAATHLGAILFVSIYWPFIAEPQPKAAAARVLSAMGLAVVGYLFFDLKDAKAISK